MLLSEWLSTVLPLDEAEITVEKAGSAQRNELGTIIPTGRWPGSRAVPGGGSASGWPEVAPTEQDVPVFASYRLDHQFEVVMRLAGELTDDAGAAGALAEHRRRARCAVLPDGLHRRGGAPDVMPYTFGNNWFADAARRAARTTGRHRPRSSAKLHSIPNADKTFDFLADADPPGDTALHRHFGWLKDWYVSSPCPVSGVFGLWNGPCDLYNRRTSPTRRGRHRIRSGVG